MIDLSKSKDINLPDSIKVDGVSYKVHTDYRYGIAFVKLCETKPKLTDFDSFYEDVYNIPLLRQKGLDKLIEFYNPSEVLPNKDVYIGDNDYKAFDYVIDSSMIYAAFMQQYKIDLLDVDMHWYKFLALFRNLKDTRLNDVMGYRGYNPSDKTDYTKQMKRNQQLWEIRETDEDAQTLNDKFNERFN